MPEIRPLRPGDPPRLGEYSLKGRLGEGGQGVVYLGQAEPTHPPSPAPTVAAKVTKVSTGSPLLDRIKATGRLRVGYRGGLPGISLGDDPPRGFEADVAAHLAKALAVPDGGLRFVPVGYSGRETAVEKGKVDLVISNLSIDDADRERAAFAGPYYVAHRDVLVLADAKIDKLKDLRGKRICLSPGQTTGTMIRSRGVDFIPTQGDPAQCASQVGDGSADAMVGDDLLIAGFGARLRGVKVRIVGVGLTAERYGVALRTGDPVACRKINEVITSMYADGTMKGLLERHLGRVDFRFETALPRLESCS